MVNALLADLVVRRFVAVTSLSSSVTANGSSESAGGMGVGVLGSAVNVAGTEGGVGGGMMTGSVVLSPGWVVSSNSENKCRYKRTLDVTIFEGIREVVLGITGPLSFSRRRTWWAVRRVGWEEFPVIPCKQFLHPSCLEMFYDEFLVLFETVTILDLGDSALFREYWIG